MRCMAGSVLERTELGMFFLHYLQREIPEASCLQKGYLPFSVKGTNTSFQKRGC